MSFKSGLRLVAVLGTAFLTVVYIVNANALASAGWSFATAVNLMIFFDELDRR